MTSRHPKPFTTPNFQCASTSSECALADIAQIDNLGNAAEGFRGTPLLLGL
jgi:hypothetical protein